MKHNSSEISNPAQFLEIVNAFRISKIILSAADLRIFDHLDDKGTSSGDLAVTLGTDPRATDRLLNVLVSLKILSKSNGRFANTIFSNKFLRSSSSHFLSGLALTSHTWKTWSTLSEVLLAGTSIAFEKPINERSPEWREAFITAMHRRAGPQAVEVADAIDLSRVKRVLDVGGGSGAFAIEFLKRNPAMTGVVFDLPNIVTITRRFLYPDLLPGTRAVDPVDGSPGNTRISVVAGDYLEDDLGSGFDLVFMSAIIHINSPDENRLLIRKGAEALNQGGQLVILDHIMSEDRTEPLAGALFAINMLVGTKHGDTYTENEIRSWMIDAGLKEISLITTPSEVQLMTGRKS